MDERKEGRKERMMRQKGEQYWGGLWGWMETSHPTGMRLFGGDTGYFRGEITFQLSSA